MTKSELRFYREAAACHKGVEMSSLATTLMIAMLLTLSLAGSQSAAQEVEDTEIEFLEIKTFGSGSGDGIELILTANQFVERIYLENSYDLKTWQTNEVFPNWDFDVEGQVSFLSSPFGLTFYRARIAFPIISLFKESIQVANGVESQAIAFGVTDPIFFGFPEIEAVSSNTALIPQENIKILRGLGNSISVTPTYEGVGDVPIDIIVTGIDGVQVKATLVVTVVEGGGIAPQLDDFYDAVLLRKFPGLNYVFSTTSTPARFSRNGEPGNWFYVIDPEDSTTAFLGFSYDESENNVNIYQEIVRLIFLTDRSGNYEYIEVVNGSDQIVSEGAFDLEVFPEFGAGASPTEAAFARMAVGKHIVNAAWTFDSATRFNYTEPGGSPERGNWKYVMTGEKTGRVTLTYDEDNNNASIYREEIDLTFETIETGSFVYKEYFGTELNNTFGGVFDFRNGP